ncbi:alpha/beta hydrolase [Streptomyces griseoflavus]|uniref:alpha/beta fold hydrolase n=1 Tax=Streptomyces griseoflavus TaxID=35619 RepID=UPI0033A88B73
MTASVPGLVTQSLTVPVSGGELAVTRWPGSGPPVVALHGITANSLAFADLAEELPDADLYAPDLRGRAASAALPGPYGLAAHVRDTVALLDHLGRRQAVLVGHSMGAFVAALAAARHPERFPRVVLVDGGLGFPAPAGTDIDELLQAVIGPAMDRLSMTFEDRESYLAFFRAHPALAPHWGPRVAAYVDRDLTGRAPELRSSCVLDAVRADGADVLGDPEVLAAVHRSQVRGTLLWAERGLLDEPRALYDSERVAAAGLDPDRMPARRVDGTNHYSILFPPAAGEVAAAVRAAMPGRGEG